MFFNTFKKIIKINKNKIMEDLWDDVCHTLYSYSITAIPVVFLWRFNWNDIFTLAIPAEYN